MHSRKQYLEELRKEYEEADLAQRGRLLDEAQKRTGMNAQPRAGAGPQER